MRSAREHEVQVVLLEAALGAHLDGVTEAGGGHQRRPGASATDQCVGGQRRAVDERLQVGQVGSGVGDDLVDAVENALFGGVVRGEDLG